MFGSHQDKDSADKAQVTPAAGTSTFTMDPLGGPSLPGGPVGLPPEPTASPVNDATSAPHLDDASGPTSLPPAAPVTSPTATLAELDSSVAEQHNDAKAPATDSVADGELLSIKTQALTQLSPLIDHLDQPPEEKFKTLMMMIQANDNQALIKDAYETAQKITDEKAKSQALLDVVNEINYFTQKKK